MSDVLAERGRTMKAIVREGYGSADVLRLRDVKVPDIGADEVLVRVRAAGLDRGAWHVMAGLPYLIRCAGYGLRRPRVAGLGSELAGVVEAAGANVTGLEPGEKVFGTGTASFPSTPRRGLTRSRGCRRTSASSRPPRFPSPPSPLCRRCASELRRTARPDTAVRSGALDPRQV